MAFLSAIWAILTTIALLSDCANDGEADSGADDDAADDDAEVPTGLLLIGRDAEGRTS